VNAAALRVALGIGFAIDAFVDLPVKDPALVSIAGGEFAVAAGIYGLVFRDPERFRPLLWLCALDQLFAVVLPGLAIVSGHIPATVKTVGPLPLQLLLAAFFAFGATQKRSLS
jgi:hypothetical protein